jgi:uncharacterized membrane protein YvbJ
MFCPSCGEEVADDSGFCRYCGEDLDPESGSEPEPAVRPTASSSESEPEPEPEENETSAIKKLGYWGGRIVQLVLIGLAVIFIGGSLSMNVIQFAAIGILALVLLGFAGVIEVLIVRPSSS